MPYLVRSQRFKMGNKAVIGIDTSNYTTSCAAVSENGEIISDRRILLSVKEGQRGLRQQEALFQHVSNLPVLIHDLMSDIDGYEIAAISCSVRPRPVEGSYMPVFNAGKSVAEVISDTLKCPVISFSHQEGHVEAARYGTLLEDEDDMVFFHLSGGTTEAVSLPGYDLVGKTLDISFGQFIDRVGVAMVIGFPCGGAMDEAASDYEGSDIPDLPVIKVKDAEVNLSGIETFCQNYLGEHPDVDEGAVSKAVFDACSYALAKMIKDIYVKTGKKNYLLAGGVSSSRYIRKKLEELILDDVTICFGRPELCRDNAVGIALLGGKKIWR